MCKEEVIGCGISISSSFLMNFKFHYINYLKYLLKNCKFQFSFNFFIQTTHFTPRNSSLKNLIKPHYKLYQKDIKVQN